MFFGLITLLTGLALSTVAAWFAIEGIMAIFAGMPIYGMIMGIVVEAGKVVGVTWMYRHWTHKTKLKFIMIPVVTVALLLTSMGIFGLLSKAHIEQTAPVTNNTAQIERLDQRIARELTDIADAEAQITQLDETLQVLIDANIISDPVRGARVVRERQQPERDLLKQEIDESMDAIDEYEDQKLILNQELNDLEREVGPVKYIAAIIYEEPEDSIEEAVRIVIIAFIFVFDPMAILLLMAGNYTLMGRIGAAPVVKEDDSEDTPGGELIELIDGDDPERKLDEEDLRAILSVDPDVVDAALEKLNARREPTADELAAQSALREFADRRKVDSDVRAGNVRNDKKVHRP